MIEKLARKSAQGDGDIEGHLLAITGLAIALNAKMIIETGVREGNSTEALLTAAGMIGGEVVSIDIKETPYTPPDSLRKLWSFVQSDALVALAGLAQGCAGRCDLIVLDDWHSAEHVQAELELCKKLLSPNGMVIIHDAMWLNTQPHYNSQYCAFEFAGCGPWGAISKLDRDEWEYVTVPAHNGLTLLRRTV